MRMNIQQSVQQSTERSSDDRQRSESANPAVPYRDVRMMEDIAEDLSRPSSSSFPHHRPSAHAGSVGAAAARLAEENALPMKLPPPAHSHHRRTDIVAADHIMADSSMRHRSPARNMPSPRGHMVADHLPTDRPPGDDVPWPIQRTILQPYFPPAPCTVASTGGSVPKFSAATSGPPPLIHEPVKSASGGGSIVLGTPLSPEQRRRHFEPPSAIGMLYKSGNDPNVLRSGPFAGPLITQPMPLPPAPQDGQFPIIARQSGVPWPAGHMQQSVIRATSDANMTTSSRDLLYGDLLTARQMHRGQVAVLADSSADRRRVSPRSASSYTSLPWQHGARSDGRNEPAGPQYLDDVHRADLFHKLPWPVRPPASVTRYSVCGEPSRQCYTPPLPIHKAFVSRDPVPGSLPSGDHRSSFHENANISMPGRFLDPNQGGPKVSPQYKGTAEKVSEWRLAEVQRSPARDTREVSSVGGHHPDNIQAPAVTAASDQLTAANLIDAIIIEQINNQEPGPVSTISHGHSPGRSAPGAIGNMSILERLRTETSTTSDQPAGSGMAPVLCSPVEKPQPCVRLSPSHSGKKDMTLGEHIHSIIMHDFKQKDGGAADISTIDTSSSLSKI